MHRRTSRTEVMFVTGPSMYVAARRGRVKPRIIFYVSPVQKERILLQAKLAKLSPQEYMRTAMEEARAWDDRPYEVMLAEHGISLPIWTREVVLAAAGCTALNAHLRNARRWGGQFRAAARREMIKRLHAAGARTWETAAQLEQEVQRMRSFNRELLGMETKAQELMILAFDAAKLEGASGDVCRAEML